MSCQTPFPASPGGGVLHNQGVFSKEGNQHHHHSGDSNTVLVWTHQIQSSNASNTHLIQSLFGLFGQSFLWTVSCLVDAAATAARLLQSCPTLCNPIDGSPPGSPIPGILQARTREWLAISFSNAQKQKVTVKSLSRV